MKRIRVGVVGSAGVIPQAVEALSIEVGAEIARRGGVLFTGGRDGVMAAASRGASEAGGLVVGILPGDSVTEGNPWIDIPITTGLGFEYRSGVLVHSVDVVIGVAGGNGTLGEISLAYLVGRPVVCLEGSGGWADRLRSTLIEAHYLDSRRNSEVHFAGNPAEAVDLAFRLAAQGGGRPAWIG